MKLLSQIMAAATIAALMTPVVPSDASLLFSDVPAGHTYETAITWLSHSGITKGCNPPTNDQFCPHEYVTRGQMASFLTRALNLTDDGAGNTFTDDNDSVYETDISKIAAAGITKGCNPPTNDQFCPYEYVTRGQMASFLYRSLSSTSDGTSDRYWDWGWGVYNPGLSVEAKARFDWSTINFGDIPPTQDTLDRLNQILELNPSHKFVIRVWPILSLGDSTSENNNQASLFHYLYKPGVRDAVLQEVAAQIEFILGGINKPENVVGLTFLEELPQHFTTDRETLGWQRGQPMPWDIARFEADITADLGEPFDMAIEAHRLWWGSKLTGAINEIHAEMKSASGGINVFLWQGVLFQTLDTIQPGESMVQDDVVPIHYRDIIKPGLADGIFGYPNTDSTWQTQTMDIVEGFDIPFWSQSSTPGVMRGSTWTETILMAREKHPNNLGTMFFLAPSTGNGDWNPMPYEDGAAFWTIEDHASELAELMLGY